MADRYQRRYLAHQARKAAQLLTGEGETAAPAPVEPEGILAALRHRRSQRLFESKPVAPEVLKDILAAAGTAPSSCNRRGVRVVTVTERDEKELLAGLLVGGVGWCHRAGALFLFLADETAYKSPREKGWMHWCDVGFVAFPMWLVAESHGLGACYINPNVSWPGVLASVVGPGTCCGALAVGHIPEGRRALEADRS